MKYQVHWYLVAVIIVLIVIWQVNTFNRLWSVRPIEISLNPVADERRHAGLHTIKNESDSASRLDAHAGKKCNLPTECPVDSFPFNIRSGAANIVGPSICFDGKIIMSHVLNNVGPGLNIVLINGVTGDVEDCMNFNRNHKAEELIEYLTDIQPLRIVMAASFDDLDSKMPDAARDLFAQFGSNLLKSLKSRDSWVFVGSTDSERTTAFEKICANDENANKYEGWPQEVQLASCYPRIVTDVDQP